MSDISPKYDFDRLVEGQAAHAQANVIFAVLENMSQLVVIDRDLTAPPGSESDGDVYIPASVATGDWSGQEGRIAIYYNGGWISNENGDFPSLVDGMCVWVADENVMLLYDGSGLNNGVVIADVSPPDSQRVFKSPLAPDVATPFQTISDTAYFVYVGRVLAPIVPKYVEAHKLVASAGTQTAELGLFSSPVAPNKSAQSLTKIEATGTVTDMTGGGEIVRNTSAFVTAIAPGTHLWAGIRTAHATTQPKFVGLLVDMLQGFVLTDAAAGALTGSGPWTGDIVSLGTLAIAPGLRVTMD